MTYEVDKINKTYLISYKGKNSTFFKKSLTSFSDTWFNHFDGQYIIKSNLDSSEIYDRIKTFIDLSGDIVLVLKVDILDCKGYLNERGREWICNNI